MADADTQEASLAAAIPALHRRAWDRAVRAVDAPTLDGLHAVATQFAIIDVLTGVRRHGLDCFVTAHRTRNDRLQFHWSPSRPNWIDKQQAILLMIPDVSGPKSEPERS